jgi:flagellar basal body P-ring formation protein FlgA
MYANNQSHDLHSGPRRAVACLLCLGVLSLAWPGLAAAQGWQAHDEIRAAAAAAALAAAPPGPAPEVRADAPDPRVRLPDCDQPLTGVVAGVVRPKGRVTAEVRCDGSRPWNLYVPVQILGSQAILVAARSLARDTVLAPADVRLAQASAGMPGYGALSDPGQVTGKRLRRNIEEGTPVTAALLDAPVLIRRGQQVTLEAAGGGLSVKMAGVARTDGSFGDIIEVENGGSGRVVQAVVRSAKSVEVLLR